MQIKRLSDGQKFEGPDGPVPDGFEAVKAAPQKQQMVEFPSMTGYIAGNIKRHPENLAAAVASGLPGEGMLMAGARPLMAAGLTKALGSDWETAAKGAVETLTGQLAGGIVRPVARTVGSALDKTVKTLASQISKAVPEFAGKTPAEVFNRIVGGEGIAAVQKDYGDTLRRLWKQNIGTEFPTGRITPEFREMIANIAKSWPKAAQEELAALNGKYRTSKIIEDWVNSVDFKKLMPGRGEIAVPPLQEAFATQRRSVAEAIPGVERTLRMPPESAARDVPASGLLQNIGGHVSPGGFWAYLRGLPHAARRAEEGEIPELAANVARQLGVMGTAEALRPQENR